MADTALSFPLGKKYIDFINCNAQREFLEGTTFAGKTTVGQVKFILKVSDSKKREHVLCGLDLGTIEKNIITKDNGILDVFGELVEYFPSGRGKHSLPHIVVHTARADKVVYVVGYDTKTRWKKLLGGQYGCLMIDEINVADMELVREVMMRCDYALCTLNPDDPRLPVYKEYINHARPLSQWESDTPKEILEQLKESFNPGWVHWFFSFSDNASLTPEKHQQIVTSVAPGTKQYKNKIQGLRGRATGLIFNLQDSNIIDRQDARKFDYVLFSSGLDTSYSQSSADTFSFVFGGITTCRRVVILEVETYNNRDLPKPLTPSDIPPLYERFLQKNRAVWGFSRDNFIDSADQATILECQKYRRLNGSVYNYIGAWKKTQIIDRINLQCGWMAKGDYLLVRDTCKPLEDELNSYSWKEDKYEPEDGNDHCINAAQYMWLPFKDKIGGLDNENQGKG